MAKGERAKFDFERCKGCRLCIVHCPKDALVVSDKPNSRGYFPVVMGDETKCTGCGICALVCPDCGITFVPAGPKPKEEAKR